MWTKIAILLIGALIGRATSPLALNIKFTHEFLVTPKQRTAAQPK